MSENPALSNVSKTKAEDVSSSRIKQDLEILLSSFIYLHMFKVKYSVTDTFVSTYTLFSINYSIFWLILIVNMYDCFSEVKFSSLLTEKKSVCKK